MTIMHVRTFLYQIIIFYEKIKKNRLGMFDWNNKDILKFS
jgi:hypothetical protein